MFGFGGNNGNNQNSSGFPGLGNFGEMKANINFSGSHTSSSSTTGSHGMSGTSSFGQQDDPGKKSKEMQDRYKYREEKLPTYTALVDILEHKGEDVRVMRECIYGAKMTHEELQRGYQVFEKVTAAMLQFDFAQIMQ